MDTSNNRFLSVVYQLYSVTDGKRTLEEQTSPNRPFEFISGFGIALDALETNLLPLESGSDFEFTLKPEEAFGLHDPQGIHKLSRDIFSVNGRFDGEHVFEGAIINLMNAEGQPLMAQVIKVEADEVTIDANHPLAGKELCFTGIVKENRPATEEEVNALIKHLTGGCHCGGGCHKEGGCEGNCHEDGGCNGDCEKDGGCKCGCE